MVQDVDAARLVLLLLPDREDLELPPDPAIVWAVREMQREFVRRFSPGRFIVLDVEHSMEQLIPERIAREIERVIVAAEGA